MEGMRKRRKIRNVTLTQYEVLYFLCMYRDEVFIRRERRTHDFQ